MAKNAINYTGLIPETGDSFESATQNTTGSFDGIDTKIGTMDDEITDINNEVDTIDTSLSGHISNTLNPHSVTKSQIGLGNAEDTNDLTKMTVVTFSGLNTTKKTIVGAINEIIVTDSAINGNIKIAGVENVVYTHPNHSGDIISNGDGATAIQNNVVGNSKLAQVNPKIIKGNKENVTGNVQDLTVSDVQSMIQDSTHRFVTDAQINTWNSLNPNIKYYDTQALAITDAWNINVGDKIQTFGGSNINDGLGGLYRIESSLSNGGFTIATGKHANYLNMKDLGVGQTWQNVTGSRTSGQTYTNTTGKPIVVELSGSTNTSLQFIGDVYVNGVNISKGQGTSQQVANEFRMEKNFIVPVGATYSVNFTLATMHWFELR